MQESKLIKYLKQSDTKTRERFRAFVKSPYFNQHQPTIKLLDYILKHINKKPSHLERQTVFRKLFPKESYSDQLVFNLMSSLKKLYHRFLAQEQMAEHPFLEDIHLLQSTYQNNQFDLLKNRAKQIKKKIDQYPFSDTALYQQQYEYYQTLGYYHSTHENRAKVSMLQEMLNALDKHYMLEKLRNCCHLTANMIMLNTSFDFGLLDDVIQYYESNRAHYEEEYPIKLYYTILQSLREENNPEHYHQLKQMMIGKDITRLNPEDQSELFRFAINFCIRHINRGESVYQKELFELYQRQLEMGLILRNKMISEWNYKNINALGCALGEFEWTESFLDEYKEKLPQAQRENAYNYNMGHLEFSKKQYSAALDHLLEVRFSDVNYHLSYNNLLLATYYAMGDTEALMGLIETYRIYVIRNQKMTTDTKRQYTNFLRFAKKLTTIKQQPRSYGKPSKQEKFAQLFLKIKESNNLVNRYWLEKTCREEAGTALEPLLEAHNADHV